MRRARPASTSTSSPAANRPRRGSRLECGSHIESFPLFGYDLDNYSELFAAKLNLPLALAIIGGNYRPASPRKPSSLNGARRQTRCTARSS
jgi:hypothetical protein